VLPPSTIVSPGSRTSANDPIVSSVIRPAGTITHAVRGFSSLEAKSGSESAPVAPLATAALTASGETS
jgi:hypothetical protein